MIYLTGRKILDDFSDNEDPEKALKIPANDLCTQDPDGDNSDDAGGIYGQNDQMKKFIIEIND
jgi:hypothetical protein